MIRTIAVVLVSTSAALSAAAQSTVIRGAPITGDVQLAGSGLHPQTFSRILTQSALASWPATRAQLCNEIRTQIENPRSYPSAIATPGGPIPMTVHPKITSCTIGPAMVASASIAGDTIRIEYDVAGNSLAGSAEGTVGPFAVFSTQNAGADYAATFDIDIVAIAPVPAPGQPLDIHSVTAGWHNVKPTLTLRGSSIVSTILNPMLPTFIAGIQNSRLNLPQLTQRVTPSLTALDAALTKLNSKMYGYYDMSLQGGSAKTLVFTAMKGAPPKPAGSAAAAPAGAAVAANVLDQYAGNYRVSSGPTAGLVISVQHAGSGLQLSAVSIGQSVPLTATNATTFAVNGGTVQVSFVRDAAGHVSGLVVHANGSDTPAVRI